MSEFSIPYSYLSIPYKKIKVTTLLPRNVDPGMK